MIFSPALSSKISLLIISPSPKPACLKILLSLSLIVLLYRIKIGTGSDAEISTKEISFLMRLSRQYTGLSSHLANVSFFNKWQKTTLLISCSNISRFFEANQLIDQHLHYSCFPYASSALDKRNFARLQVDLVQNLWSILTVCLRQIIKHWVIF